MKPNTFVMIALAAVASSVVAVAVYSTNNQWDQGRIGGDKLVPALTSGDTAINSLAITREGKTLTLEGDAGGRWTLKERNGYPVNPDKIRALLVKLAQAELIEAKTRKPDRHALLELEDPTAKDAKSRALKILSGSGVVADLVIGKRHWDAFGSGKSGTYVRKAGESQTWLANAELDVSADVRTWIEPTVFQTDNTKIRSLAMDIPGEETLRIERKADEGSKAAFVGLPEDAKLKDTTAADAILRAAASIDAEDVRKLDGEPMGDDVSTVAYSTSDGLEVRLRVRKDGDEHWLSIVALGSGDAKSAADTISSETGGWEFRISSTKAGALLKRRADLIESS